MSSAYDCNYDFVDDPKQALVEAHEEIRKLESKHADEIARLRLTDAEREAIEWSAKCADDYARVGHRQAGEVSATLRNLLERLK